MGSGHNSSLSVGASARRKASIRTPGSFWLNVPTYQYELECTHIFRSRTPILESGYQEDYPEVWCEECRAYEPVFSLDPINQPVSNDEHISLQQDVGIIKERIAVEMQRVGFLQSEEDLDSFYRQALIPYGTDTEVPVKELADRYHISFVELRKINQGLTAPEGLTFPELCPAGLHEMTAENTILRERGKKRCRACWNTYRQKYRARSKTEVSPGLL